MFSRWPLTLLLCICSWPLFADTEPLYKDPVWSALLHISNDTIRIEDPDFILSHADFSLENEMQATLRYLYESKDKQAVCRFPARYLWLQRNLELPLLPLAQCDDLNEFLERAPADEVALVYASENLTQPSSMMGHIFLNIAGQNNENERVEHSISFFTEIDSWNLPKVFFESLATGKPGYYALSPYREQILRYLHEERRNVWRYQLRLDDFQRELIHLHLYELRGTQLTYFFHDYNCATLVNFVMALAAPEVREPESFWLTPLDVVRASQQAGLVEQVSIQPSTHWYVRALSEQLPAQTVRRIGDSMQQAETAQRQSWLMSDLPLEESFLELELASAVNDLFFENERIERAQWEQQGDEIEHIREQRFTNMALDLSGYKDPLQTPRERQGALGFTSIDDNHYMRLELLPASHRLEDDNRQYFNESALQLGDLSLLLDPLSGKLRLDRFTLYGVQSLMPYQRLTGGLSGRMQLGLDQHYDGELDRHRAAYMEGALGTTLRVRPGLDMYLLLGGGAGYADSSGYLYANPEAGLIMRQRGNMKSMLSWQPAYNQLGDQELWHRFRFDHIKYLGERYALSFAYTQAYSRNAQDSERRFDLSIKRYF